MHCPNTNTTKSHFSQGSDMDLNITENDKICTSCYKSRLKIIIHLKQNCHDCRTIAGKETASVLCHQDPASQTKPV